jgi:beta-aspartyl-peptidase (threonine type)
MPKPCLIVHGGAGHIEDDRVEAAVAGCREACAKGLVVLDRGGSALDAVETAVRSLEDDPVFNAGRGAVLNADGAVEMDACVMTGDLRIGAVGCVRSVANPISLARRVMERTRHVFLVGAGADQFAAAQGFPLVGAQDLITERQLARWKSPEEPTTRETRDGGTVGAVAVDASGSIAAATSTGGLFRKMPGRVGDTPVIGSGTYADARSGAASATGFGEDIIRVMLARTAVEFAGTGAPVMQAARRAIDALATKTTGTAGVILVTPDGDVGFAFNTKRMSHAFRASDGTIVSGVDPR